MDGSLLPSATTEAADNVFSMTGSVSGRKEDHQEDDDLTSSEVLIQASTTDTASFNLAYVIDQRCSMKSNPSCCCMVIGYKMQCISVKWENVANGN